MYTILVADDDADLLHITDFTLTEAGYAVLTARDAYQAIRILAERHVDLLLTDVRMPGLSGSELASQVRGMRPKLHIIQITGFAEAASRQGRIIQNPIRPAELVKLVKDELSAA